MRRFWVSTAVAAVVASAIPGARPAESASPAFTLRGVIQGSYGPQWRAQDRRDALVWMSTHGLNVYIHAPKDDAYQRAQWRNPYPADQQKEILSEIAEGRRRGVDWVPNISPGFPLIPTLPTSGLTTSRDICFSCPADLEVLYKKLDPFFNAGARRLMVSFDDVQKVSTHPEDAATYGEGDAAYGAMNRDLLNAVQRHYAAKAGKDGFQLITVLASYAGTSDSKYLAAIRANGGLDKRIQVLWTGITVVAPQIRTQDAKAYAKLVGHDKVGIWDNYPANDIAGNIVGHPKRIYLGPYEGRAKDLNKASDGIVINVMNEAWASRPAMGTLSKYLAAPTAYQPEGAWRDVLKDLGRNRRDTDALSALAENSRSSGLNHFESPVFSKLRDAFITAYDSSPFWNDEAAALQEEARREKQAAPIITFDLPALGAEIGPFLERLKKNADVISAGVDVLHSMRPEVYAEVRPGPHGSRIVSGTTYGTSAQTVATFLATARTDQALTASSIADVHGDRITPALDDPSTTFHFYSGLNLVDAFVSDATARAVQWLARPTPTGRPTVTVNGVRVPLDGNSFAVTITKPGVIEVIATDTRGGRSGVKL